MELQAAFGAQFVPEVAQLLDRKPTFKERARIDAGRRVPLKVDHVGAVRVLGSAEEVVEADLEQRRYNT